MVQKKRRYWQIFSLAWMCVLWLMVGTAHHVNAQEPLSQATVGNAYTIGLDDTFAPMAFRDDSGELVGFDVDLAKAVAELYDWNLTFQPIDWSVKETELKSGTIDMIWNGYGITPEREQQVLLSNPYITDRQMVVVRKDSDIEALDDLKGKKIALQSGSTGLEYIKQWPEDILASLDGEPVLYPDNNQVLADLQSGRVDAAYMGELYARYILSMRGDLGQYVFIPDQNSEEPMGVGLRQGETELKQAIDSGMEELKANGTYQEIEEKWLGEPTDTGNERSLLLRILPSLLDGLKSTIILFVVTLVLSLPLGGLVGILRTFAPKLVRQLVSLYIFVMRGTPLMLQLMIVFFGLPFIGLSLPRFPAALLALVLNYAAYFAEIFRGGYQSVPAGQYENLRVLGIGRFRGFCRIIFPQVFRIVFPSVGNEVISLEKDTSLVYIIGLGELLRAGSIASNREASLLPYLAVGVIYLLFTAVITWVLKKTEKSYQW